MSAPVDQPDYSEPTWLGSSRFDNTVVGCPNLVETTLIIITGIGELFWLLLTTTHDRMGIRIYCDGVLAWYEDPEYLQACGYIASTPCVSLIKFTDGGACAVQNNLIFKFRHTLRIAVFNASGAPQTARAEISYSLIR